MMGNAARAAMKPADIGFYGTGNWAALADGLPQAADNASDVTRAKVDLPVFCHVFAAANCPPISAVGLGGVWMGVSGGEIQGPDP